MTGLGFDDEDDDDDDDEDDEDDDDEDGEEGESDAAANTRLKSPFVPTSALDDPVLVTHAKCLADGILSSWKRRLVPQRQQLVKELWIFWSVTALS